MRRRQRERLGEGLSPPPSRKGLWSPEEDEKLIACIIHNTGMAGCSWAYVAKQAGLDRCGKSCRLRWINYLRPGLKRGSFSSQEERFIIKLQSILGNSRWSQIAAHIPGRTDNEIKNYWNSSIKKKLKLKHHVSCTTTTTNARSNIPSQSDSICNTNSVFSHIHDAFRSSHSAQPYFESMLEGYQTPSCNTFNVVTTGENQFCVSGILESKQEQVQDQDNDLISYFEKWTNADTSTHTHDRVSSHAAFIFPSLEAQGLHTYSTSELPANDELMIESCRTTVPPPEAPATANYSLSSTRITVPAVIQRECLKEEIENDGWGYWSHAVDPGAYITHEAGISIAEDYKSLYEKTTHQSCSPLSFHSQFGSPAIKWPCGQSNDFQGEDEYRDPRNMIYDVHLAQIDGGGALSDHDQDFSIILHAKTNANSIPTNLGRTEPIILHEKTNANPIPSYLGGERSGPFEIEWKSGPGQVTNWAEDDIYNFDTGAVSDLASLII